jgi:hypothetical protein
MREFIPTILKGRTMWAIGQNRKPANRPGMLGRESRLARDRR